MVWNIEPAKLKAKEFRFSFSVQQCMDIFGPQFNSTYINSAVDSTNTNYGGFGYIADKVSLISGPLFVYCPVKHFTSLCIVINQLIIQLVH